jgi:hypothetical protein
MTSKTAWAGGNLNTGSVGYQAAFSGSSSVLTLANGNSVMSDVTFDNTGGLDQWIDVSAVCTIGTTPILAGACLPCWLAFLQADGTTYGDGIISTTPAAITPASLWPLGAVQFSATATGVTKVVGSVNGLLLPPRRFALVVQNLSGANFTGTSTIISISTYNQNLNA